MTFLDDYSIYARESMEFKCESLLPDFSYSSDYQLSARRVGFPQPLKQHNFRRARSCDNILDEEKRDFDEEREQFRKEEVVGFHFGRAFESTIDKE